MEIAYYASLITLGSLQSLLITISALDIAQMVLIIDCNVEVK